MRKVQLPGEIDFSETEHPEMKLTEKKGEQHKDVHGSPEVENDKELKTKL